VSLLDLIALAILGFSVGAGFMAGFARAGIGFLAGLLGIVFGFWFYGTPAAWVHQYIHSVWASNIIGFLLVYWAFLLGGALIGRVFSKLFKWTGLSWLDRLMGAGFGLVRGSLITVAFVAVLMAFAPKPLPNWMVDSKLLPYAMDASNVIAGIAPSAIKDAFRTSMRDIRSIWEQQLQEAQQKVEFIKPAAKKKGKAH
jgi:membrane protein required for colicin V production